MFEQFPKTRPPLPRQIAELYTDLYKSNRSGQTSASSLAQKVESWMHKKVAEDVAGDPGTKKTTLEIGAGTLNQLPYEPDGGPYDIIEPFKNLYNDSPLLRRVRNVYDDIAEVPDQHRYDRITSVATFEHVLDLPALVARAGILLTPGGALRTAIPSEGTFLWTLGWKLTTGLEFKLKYGLDYSLLMKHEHVNRAREIEEVLDFFFEKIESACFGPAKPVSLYQFFACSQPRIGRCREYAGKPAA